MPMTTIRVPQSVRDQVNEIALWDCTSGDGLEEYAGEWDGEWEAELERSSELRDKYGKK